MSKSSESSIVTKCALVMDVLAEARSALAFSEIVERTGFVKSTCHRILAVLARENLIEYDKPTRTYKTGSRFHNWSRLAWRRIDLQEIANKSMTSLSEQYGLNVALSVRDDDNILYLRTVDHVPLRYAASTGDYAPLHCTAAGKVFLAYMPEKRRKELVGRMKFEKLTEKTITSPSEILNELPGIIVGGYCLVVGEEFLQVSGMAAPIWNENGEVVACLSIWMTDAGEDGSALEQHASALKAATKSISVSLGWQDERE
ncbi:IclR family transcriptional regulator [Roseibium sp.]|uniref:IclR family transcriptional regulator n=1 Tax=Roseibium sp. TaxID=1936156 RepID=UPI003B513F27